MKKQLLLLLVPFALVLSLRAQITSTQYFDGTDSQPLTVTTDSGNVWQIGQPQKTLFNAAASVPNVLITDTLNPYPANADAAAVVSYLFSMNQGIMAMQWKQKLDLDSLTDGGFVEYSTDNGSTWVNAFNNPYVYNFYGYDSTNVDTLPNGQIGFTGTDTTWRDIWICFDASYFIQFQTALLLRLRLVSDSVSSNREGWMVDNMIEHLTIFHTAGLDPQPVYMRVYPTLTTGIVTIEMQKLQEYHVIESIEIFSADGKLVKSFGLSPTKFWFDMSTYPNGVYYVKVKTNKKTETHKVVLQHQ
jgi:Secretion system C-terminal sorting domain